MTAEPGTDAFYKEFRFEVDSLQGNINRMCVTDSTEELSSMRNWAHSRINLIYEMRALQIKSDAERKKEG